MHVPAVVFGLLQISIFRFCNTLQEFQFSIMSQSFQSPLSPRIRRIVPTGNTAVDFTANQQRQALIDICEMSHSHPMHRVATRDFVRSLITNQSRATEIVQDNLFEKEVKTCNDFPLGFVLQWLLKATRLTSLDLGKIKCFDSAQLRQPCTMTRMWLAAASCPKIATARKLPPGFWTRGLWRQTKRSKI